MKSFMVFMLGVFFLMVLGLGLAFAQGDATPLADLTIESLKFSSPPQDGAKMSSLKIRIKNEGELDAPATKIKLDCVDERCSQGDACDEVASALHDVKIDVPPIKKGESVEVVWAPASPVKWVSGKYTIVAVTDFYNVVRESDEEDNLVKSAYDVESIAVSY